MSRADQKRKPAEQDAGRAKDGLLNRSRGHDSTLLDAAVEAAAEGLFVFPVHPKGKTPLIEQWQHKATRDTQTICEWWKLYPAANIGCHAGKSGLAVIDVDPRNGGNETFAELEALHGSIASEVETMTGGGGRHLFFLAPEGVKLSKALGKGVDLQSGNKYVILPPSVHPTTGKRYEWAKGRDVSNRYALDELPAWCCSRKGKVSANAPAPLDADDWGLAIRGRWDGSTEAVERVKGMMAVIAADERDTWIKVGTALHHYFEGSDAGRELWDDWSEESSKFDGDDQERTWRGFKADGAITLGTVVHLAKEHGWTQPDLEVTSKADDEDESEGPDTGGDISNGIAFAEKYRNQFLHCRASKTWYRWSAVRWERCEAGEEFRAGKKIATARYSAAFRALMKDHGNPEKKARFRQAGTVYNSVGKIRAMLDVASNEIGMSVPDPSAFDSNAMLLGAPNGVIDLRTGGLLEAKPAMLVSRQVAVPYDANAPTPPVFLKTLNAIFEGDQEMIEYFQRAGGYLLTGSVALEKLFFFFGRGANGKTMLANVMQILMGDYAITIQSALLTKGGSSNEIERGIARLPGVRLAVANEVGTNDVWADARVKELTSNAPINGRPMYGEQFEFKPTHKMLICGNYKPRTNDLSDGWQRRMEPIPFNRKFEEQEREYGLDARLVREEGSAILRWFVEGWLKLQRSMEAKEKDALRTPGIVRQAKADYLEENDNLAIWVEEDCSTGGGLSYLVTRAHEAFHAFFDRPIGARLARGAFTDRLVAMGFAKARRKEGVVHLGIGPRDYTNSDSDDL
ncbi:P4 family phage/plasmid primase-like protein [Paraburkholderia sp. RAU2J]|uniref:phage/plasmid primase, P4 family n=1 Tax=Paraburkholderia sp. RAU2J TaxID=1938810 RepID=UPI000EB5122A|nr:phage/plasmid primase, P4 family [Paraburkholderia sp. RAU2J]RKT24446.1 P4 family phage/plasmid primase-like protein [Paraburkholderia sp. RAU2J]